jgi:DMSO/TMAO reductase YedYZ heme-binding membrane subunit
MFSNTLHYYVHLCTLRNVMYSSYDVNKSKVNNNINPAPFHTISVSSSRLLVASCAVFPSPCLVDVAVCIRRQLLHAARLPTCHSCMYTLSL